MHLTLPSSSPFPPKPQQHFSFSFSPLLSPGVDFHFHFRHETRQHHPRKAFRSKKSRSVSRSETDPSSFSSQTTSSSASSEDGSKKPNGLSTPTSVLPTLSADISAEEWSEISADVYFELKQAFEMIDRDGDGKIKKEELEALLCRLGGEPPNQEELQLMLSDVDRDGDGCITLEEFYAIGSAFAPPTCDMELRDTFDFFDSDRDGKITAEELFNVFKTIGDSQCTLEDCRRMIRGVDTNGDGFVCFEDFSRMMELQQQR
ncbi:putative calcium-binding protein CML35 [Sesamum angolense]|uniref:Calcium-binding protein CML35 n=1 Tax=Sesamum angolense TaxID=2727404 RepID=A0AAE1X4Q4_9LAMI|nr:putative calcium-binding protein CML35 [Sesamum angolense]